MLLNSKREGFTLIELLVVIAILATLAVTVFVALNPAKRLRDSRDARRKTDVATILDAIHTYTIDNGAMPPHIENLTATPVTGLVAGTVYEITDGASAGTALCAGVTNTVDLSTDLQDVLADLPKDPNYDSGTNGTYTGYTITVARDGATLSDPVTTVTIAACNAENDPISVSR